MKKFITTMALVCGLSCSASAQDLVYQPVNPSFGGAIFGEDAQDEGRVVFGDQTIEFVRTLDGIQLTITEADGSTTVITVPVFTTDFPEEVSSSTTLKSDSELLVSNSGSLLEDTSLLTDSLLSTTAEQTIQ